MQTTRYSASEDMELMARLRSPTIKDDPLERAQTRVIEGIYTPVNALEDLNQPTETVDAQRDD